MPTNAGFATACGVGLESTWGTAVALTEAIRYQSDSLDQMRQKIVRATNRGRGARDANRRTHKVAGGGLVGLYTYDLQQAWLTHFMGAWTDDVGGDFYSMSDQITDALTLAIDRVVSVHEFEGYVIDQLTLAGDSDSGVTFAWEGTARQRLITGTTNNAAAIAALSEPAADVLFHECTMRIGDMGDALASGDDLDIRSFSLVLNRNKTAQAINSLYRLQSKENGHRDSTLTVTLPRYEADTFLDWEENGTALQGNLIMTDGSATQDWRIAHMKVEEVPINQSGDDQAEVPITLRLFENASAVNANTGFDFTPEVQVYES